MWIESSAECGIVEEEADEAAYRMELLVDGEWIPRERLSELIAEVNEITAAGTRA